MRDDCDEPVTISSPHLVQFGLNYPVC